jgi:DNA-binding protein H-NS
MESKTFEAMSTNGLSRLHGQLILILARKIEEAKLRLEEELRWLNINRATSPDRPRRLYPKGLPKYQNSKKPAETWSGRGKQPHWMRAQLRAGKKLEHFLIARSSTEGTHADIFCAGFPIRQRRRLLARLRHAVRIE